jgi:hypothetical protein
MDESTRRQAAAAHFRRFFAALKERRVVVVSGGRDVYISPEAPPDEGVGVPDVPGSPSPRLQEGPEADAPE